jgi:hypothetical protein
MNYSQNLIFRHKKEGFIIVDLINKTQDIASRDFEVHVYGSTNGFDKVNVDASHPVIASMPAVSGNIIEYSLAIMRHFRSNGYRLANTISNNSIK